MIGGPPPRAARLAHVPALDGLRGVAVAAVLCFHGEFGLAQGGFLGVSTFFTLSGFLITSLLLLEWEGTGRINLRAFWSRRARRLLPAAFVALVGIAVYAAYVATAAEVDRITGDGLSALFYVANWRFVLGDQSYAALFSAPSPVQHFWSLAIEEQFYLLFPLLALGLLTSLHTRGRFRIALLALAATSAALAWLLWSPGEDPSRVYYGTDTRAVELLVGAVLATALAGRLSSTARTNRIAGATIGVVGAFGLSALWLTSHQNDTFLYRGGLVLNAVLTACIIAGAAYRGPLRTALSWPPLRWLGLISYGAYLYHWPIFLWLNDDRVGFGGLPLFAIRLAVTLAVATASYQFLELPIRAGTRLRGWRPRVLAPLGAATVAVLLLVAPGTSSTSPIVFAAVNKPADVVRRVTVSGPHTKPTSTLPSTGPLVAPPPVEAPPGRSPRIMVVGDSVAITVGRGLERWGAKDGIQVINAARLYCPIARGGRLASTFGQRATACEDWPTRWTALADAFDPDVIVVLTTIWDASHRQRDEWGPDFLGPGDPRFDAFIAAEWSEAVRVLRSTGARVVWLAPPCAKDPGANLGIRYENDHYLPSVIDAGAVTIELDRRVCPDGAFLDSLDGVDDIRPDGLHFSDAGADLLAAWLGPQLVNGQ